MSTNPAILDLPCPACATFSLLNEKLISCTKCGFETRRLPLKAAYDYATFVFRYGHQCKQYHENKLKEGEELTALGNIADPHELHALISLPILSGAAGSTSMFLVQTAIRTMVAAYNDKNNADFVIPDEDITTLFGNFRIFINNFSDADSKIRNAVFEEMFIAECSKKEYGKLHSLQKKAASAKGEEQVQLRNRADKMLKEMMGSTFKKIANRPKPTPEELSAFWLKVIE